MSDSTTEVDVLAELKALGERVELMHAQIMSDLPVATAQVMWSKREGIFRLVGQMLDVPKEKVDEVLATKCVTSWEDSVPRDPTGTTGL